MENPIIKRIFWPYVAIHLLLLAGLASLFSFIFIGEDSFLVLYYAAGIYLTYSLGSRAVLLRHHRRGINFYKRGLFTEAIEEFQRSYEFLSKYKWVDRYRFIIMLDSSAIPYREMALCNIGYAYERLGDTINSIKSYGEAVRQFPGSTLAKRGLEFAKNQSGIELGSIEGET